MSTRRMLVLNLISISDINLHLLYQTIKNNTCIESLPPLLINRDHKIYLKLNPLTLRQSSGRNLPFQDLLRFVLLKASLVKIIYRIVCYFVSSSFGIRINCDKRKNTNKAHTLLTLSSLAHKRLKSRISHVSRYRRSVQTLTVEGELRECTSWKRNAM